MDIKKKLLILSLSKALLKHETILALLVFAVSGVHFYLAPGQLPLAIVVLHLGFGQI